MVTSVKSLDDLRGRAVGTWTPYQQRLRDLGIAATPFPWDDEDVSVLKSYRQDSLLLHMQERNRDVTAQCDRRGRCYSWTAGPQHKAPAAALAGRQQNQHSRPRV
jgi:hypothetical protein